MSRVLMTLSILFFIFCSLKGFTQSDTLKMDSKHPLLDKYYPRAKTDTVADNVLPKSTGVLKPAIAPVQAAPQDFTETKPVVPVIVKKTVADSHPVEEESTLPLAVQGPPVAPGSNTRIESGTVTVPQGPVVTAVPLPEEAKEDSILPVSKETIGTPPANTGIATEINPINTSREIVPVTKPVGTVKRPEAKKRPTGPEPALRRTRLGSSSPLYNTWEKNNNGAGSVTTLPKG